MSSTTGLPVFAYIEEQKQAQELRDHMRSLSKDNSIPEDILPDMTEEVHFLVKHCKILSNQDINEINKPLNSIVSLIVPLSTQKVGQVVQEFCNVLNGPEFESPAKSAVALGVLSNLFYGFGNNEVNGQQQLQYDIYCAMIQLAMKSGQITELPSEPATLRTWFAEWKLDTPKIRQLLRLLHEGLKSAQGTEAQAKIMIELLKTYTTDSEAAGAVTDARECVKAAVADPETFLFDHLVSLLPIKHLEKGDPITHRLLQIFISGNLDDYINFYNQSKDYITGTLGLNNDAMTHKMRILSLMSLGEEKQEIKFVELTKSLRLPEGEELEEFVIEAIKAGAIKARVDQVQSRILIHGVKHRKFERAQWEQLKMKLNTWEINLNLAKKHLTAVAVEN